MANEGGRGLAKILFLGLAVACVLQTAVASASAPQLAVTAVSVVRAPSGETIYQTPIGKPGNTTIHTTIGALTVTVRNLGDKPVSDLRVTLTMRRIKNLRWQSLVKAQTLAKIGPTSRRIVRFTGFSGVLFTRHTKISIALGALPSHTYEVWVPWI